MDYDDEQAAAVRAARVSSPNDLTIRVKHLGVLLARGERRAEELLWLVVNHPEADLAAYALLGRDEEGSNAFDAIRSAWDAHLASFPTNTVYIERAAEFVREEDPLSCEDLLGHGAALEVDVPRWRELLGNSLLRRARREDDEVARRDLARQAAREYEAALGLTSDELGKHILLCDIAKASAEGGDVSRARSAANGVLMDAKRFDKTWQYGNSVHWAHIALGHAAYDEGDALLACRHLLHAGATPGSPQLNSFGPDRLLAKRLAGAGYTQEVIQYLDRCSSFWRCDGGAIEQWKNDLSAGQACSFADPRAQREPA